MSVGSWDLRRVGLSFYLAQFSRHVIRLVEVSGEIIAQPAVVYVMAFDTQKIIAFRIGPQSHLETLQVLALYDAIVAGREPHLLRGGGLKWPLPSSLEISDAPGLYLSRACAQFQITPQIGHSEFAISHAIHRDWAQGVENRLLSLSHLSQLFDGYLWRTHGYSLEVTAYNRRQQFKHYVGYEADPAEVFPPLRELLPSYRQTIDAPGVVLFDGLHYANDLLSLFIGHAVELRRSEFSQATVWIYLDGAMLCQAQARELKRLDGSYRQTR